MKRLIPICLWLVGAWLLTPQSIAQNSPEIWSKVDAFSEAIAQNDILRAVSLADQLAEVDFTRIGFTDHESGELKLGFVDAMVEARRYDQAAELLDSIAATERTAFEKSASAEERSFYRQNMLDRFETLVEIEQARQNGNRIIDTMNLIVDLKTQQLGRQNPSLAPPLKFLSGHLEQRALHYANTGQLTRGLADIRAALDLYNERTRTMDPDLHHVYSLVESANGIILKIVRDYSQNNDGNGAIDFLSEQWLYLAGPWPVMAPPQLIRPLTEKRLQHYRERVLYDQSIGAFERAEKDLDTALGLIVYDSDPNGAQGAGSTPFNVEYKKWAQETLVEVLVAHTKQLFEAKDYQGALEKISWAQSVQFGPSFQGERNSEVFSLYDRAYRRAHNVPDNVEFAFEAPDVYHPTFPPIEVGGGSAYGGVDATPVPEFDTVRIFYGTNRLRRGEKLTGKISNNIEYGWTQITVPKNRKPGEVPMPAIWQRPKDGFHMVLKRTRAYSGKSEFGAMLRDSLSCGEIEYYQEDRAPICRARSGEPTEMFVFIHGHNVPFKSAALRSAQLAVDLDIENGAVFYAWPTGKHALDYRKSRKQADQSYPHLTEFLETVVRESQADQIHLIAHSMGNRILMNALTDIKAKQAANDPPLFDHVIFGSPDVDESIFANTAAHIESLARDMTLYASDKDKALKVSSRVPGNERRAGLSPPDPRIINATEKLVVVDTSKIDRKFTDLIDHADFTAGAFNDVRAAIWTQMKPEGRCVLENAKVKLKQGIQPSQFKKLTYWLAKSFRPGCDMSSFGKTLEASRAAARAQRSGLAGATANPARP